MPTFAARHRGLLRKLSRQLRENLQIKRFKAAQRHAWLRRAGLPEPFEGNLVSFSGWTIHPDVLQASSVVYSFGVGCDVGWDLEMIRRFGVTVHAFDPTPRSVQWVAQQSFPPQFRFHDCGISKLDGQIEFHPPRKPGGSDYSRDQRYAHRPEGDTVFGRVARLSTLMREMGHNHIDVLKLDVEGSEFDCVPDLLASDIPVVHLLIEIHYHYRSRSPAQGLELIQQIRRSGFRCIHISERAYEFSFLHPARL